MPAISTGCYRFPVSTCAHSLFSEAIKYADRAVYSKNPKQLNDIRFTCLDENLASYFVDEFDNRDWSRPGAPYKHIDAIMDEFLASDFKCTVVDEGAGKPIPKGALVKVHYKGKFTDGTIFDSSYERNEPTAVIVGVGAAIPGWDEAICGLKKGAKATIFCPPEYAYGDQGFGQIVPPNSTVIFELEVLDFQESANEY